MRILMRADANQNIGLGHVMRSLSVADAFRKRGHMVTFVVSNEGVDHLIHQRGYDSIILNSNYENMEEELNSWPMLNGIDIVIVDSYYVSFSYLLSLKQMLNKLGGKLVYIDDVASFPYPVDILVNYNVYGANVDYDMLYTSHSMLKPYLIVGPIYAPLRDVFHINERKNQEKKVSKVFVSTGGTDPEHIALSLVKEKPDEFIYHILIGTLNSDKGEIKALAKNQEKIVLHENVSNIKDLISDVDIAVSAAGSTLYEICACGVPLITYAFADNQIRGAETFESLGLAINLGDIRSICCQSTIILNAISRLADDYYLRCDMGNRMQNVIDGYGAERIVNEITNILRFGNFLYI